MKKVGSTLKNPLALQASPELVELQAYMPMSPEDRENLKKDIEATGEIRDPVKVYHDKGVYFILGGYNRVQIARELNINVVPVDVYEGTTEERRELVVNDNLSRRHLTQKQKTSLIDFFLKKDPEQSNKTVAKKTGTTKETVKDRREKLEAGGEIRPVEKVKGADGKSYKKPAKKSENAPKTEDTGAKAREARTLILNNYLKHADSLDVHNTCQLFDYLVQDVMLKTRKGGSNREKIIKAIKDSISRHNH